MSDGCARPVRSFLRSPWTFSTHLPMRVAASFLMSSSMMSSLSPCTSVAGDDRTDVIAPHHSRQIAGVVEVEHCERHSIVAAHDDGGRVHDIEPVGEHLVIGECLEPLG